jgi:hypothetical protein
MPADADLFGMISGCPPMRISAERPMIARARQRMARAVTMWIGDVDGDDQDADGMDVRGAGVDGAGTPG